MTAFDRFGEEISERVRQVFNGVLDGKRDSLVAYKSDRDTFVSAVDLAQFLISSVMWDTRLQTALCQHSYYHDNGFVKLVFIQRNVFPYEVRLHLWRRPPLGASEFEPLQNVHDHSADFCSIVLFGKAIEETFNERDADENRHHAANLEKFHKFACGSRGENASYLMDYLGDVVLEQSERSELVKGTIHASPYNMLHRIRILDYPFATLFIQGIRQQIGTSAYTTSRRIMTETIPSPSLNLNELFENLSWMTKLLNELSE